MRQRYALAIGLATLVLVSIVLGSIDTGVSPVHREAVFLGYISKMTRIDSVNLTVTEKRAWINGYSVTDGQKDGRSDEWVQGRGPISGTYLWLVYTFDSDYTYFSYYYRENDTEAVEWIWGLLADSLSLGGEDLERVKAYSNYGVDAAGAHIGCYLYDLKPDWSKVMAHLGSVTGRDNSRVGLLKVSFDSGANVWLNEPAIMVERSVSSGVTIGINIDWDSDIILYVDCRWKLEDPKRLFVQVFKDLGLPESDLNDTELEEHYAYPM